MRRLGPAKHLVLKLLKLLLRFYAQSSLLGLEAGQQGLGVFCQQCALLRCQHLAIASPMPGLAQCLEATVTFFKTGLTQHQQMPSLFDDVDGFINGVMATGLGAVDPL